MSQLEYLLGYGVRGEFGRFRSARPLECQRGDRAVVRSHRGLEIGEVLREAVPSHAHFLPNTSVGQFVRLVTPEDESAAAELRERGGDLLQRANRLATEMGLPLEVLDVELLLDREHAIVHHLRWAECDVRPLVSTLSREFVLHIVLADLTRSATGAAHDNEEPHGCGKEGCGGGNCGSCGTGGGCGSCGVKSPPETTNRFAGLREQMEQRTPLL